MPTTRTIIVGHQTATDIQYHVSRHQTYEQVDGSMVPKGDPYPVIEMYRRDSYNGELNRIARMKLDAFIEVSRDVVNTARELVPKSEDEASTDVAN